jgi:NADH-quinone oxidoreductase subunit F
MNQVCYRTFSHAKPWSIEAYQSVGGYQVWRSILAGNIERKEIIETVKASGLRGRGGAGFPSGVKWGFVNPDSPGPKYLVCNSDEGEPGTSKDRWILEKNPHQLLEGMLIAMYAMGLDMGYNYLRGEFALGYERCENALKEAKKAKLIGVPMLGKKTSLVVHHVLGAGSYIVGEETAMLESLEGKRAMPRFKPPFPAVSGLYGQPTIINNTETLASVPPIMEKGASWFKAMGTEQSGGTKIYSVSGHVQKPGVFEIPLSETFASLLARAGGLHPGRTLKAVIPGGTSMKIVPGEKMMKAVMSYEGIQAVGSAVGSGGMIIMDDSTCMVQALLWVMHFYRHESCGQCTPCREGTGWVYRTVKQIFDGQGQISDLDRLYDIAKKIEGRTICAFGEAVSWPVTSFLDHFRDEFEQYIHKHQVAEKIA